MISRIAIAEEDIILRDSNKCLRYFSYFERTHNIPQDLLKAVSIIETKRWHDNSKTYLPWPWAVNSQGKAYYFNSKQEAIREVKKMLEAGQKSIDVGCMQINLHYHPKAFKNLEEAFEPRNNISYGASFLKNNYERHQNWKNAVAAYHSETPEKGHPYAYKVINEWHGTNLKLVNNVNSRSHRQYASNKYQDKHASYAASNRKYGKYANLNSQRRKSDLMIKVNNKSQQYSVAQDMAQDAIASLNKGKTLKNLTFVD
ncbi:MAG: lytic transglycosylase domain-containing protein [Alphaproteobacteria bacterium]